jgi:hypothetical protein
MRHPIRALTICLVGSALVAPFTAAQANLIVNGDFEANQLSAGSYSYPNTLQDSWSYFTASIGGGLLINYGGGNGAFIDVGQTGFGGTQVGGIQGTGVISQIFTAGTTANYDVNWVDAGRSGRIAPGNETYIASVFDNTTSLLVAAATFSTTTNSIFNAESLTTLALVGGHSYTLAFTGQLAADQTSFIDSVSVNNVPEPVSLALLASGVAGLGLIRRRKAI